MKTYKYLKNTKKTIIDTNKLNNIHIQISYSHSLRLSLKKL